MRIYCSIGARQGGDVLVVNSPTKSIVPFVEHVKADGEHGEEQVDEQAESIDDVSEKNPFLVNLMFVNEDIEFLLD